MINQFIEYTSLEEKHWFRTGNFWNHGNAEDGK